MNATDNQLQKTADELAAAREVVRAYQTKRDDRYAVGAVEALREQDYCLDACHVPPPPPPPPPDPQALEERRQVIKRIEMERAHETRQKEMRAGWAAQEAQESRVARERIEARLRAIADQVRAVAPSDWKPPPDKTLIEAQQREAAVAEFQARREMELESWRRASFNEAMATVSSFEQGHLNKRDAALLLDCQRQLGKVKISDWCLGRELLGITGEAS